MDYRLSRMLHVLLHIELHDGCATSRTIARMLDTHPVVVRRMLAPFRERGIVESIRGPGGGWRMALPLDALTVADVHEALPDGSLVAIGITRDHPGCPVESAVAAGLSPVLEELEQRALGQLGTLTLESFAAAVREADASPGRSAPPRRAVVPDP